MSAVSSETLAQLLLEVRRLAGDAGDAIMTVYDSERAAQHHTKADGSPVTQADTDAENTILSGLEDLDLGYPIVSEETKQELPANSALYWLVDPLDGTKEFLNRNGEFTVNIAMVSDGSPVLGVVHAPAIGYTYYAALGTGAWKAGNSQVPAPCTPGSATPVSAVVSRSHLSAETERFLEQLPVRHVVKRGSSLKVCAVADGEADVYPRLNPTCLWDTAAGAAIALEAGCCMETPTGEPLSYAPRNGLTHSGFIAYCPQTCPRSW